MVRAGGFDEVTSELAAMPVNQRPASTFYVDLWQMAQEVCAEAEAAGVEFGERFFLSPQNPALRGRPPGATPYPRGAAAPSA